MREEGPSIIKKTPFISYFLEQEKMRSLLYLNRKLDNIYC